jgi:hypothetical protein
LSRTEVVDEHAMAGVQCGCNLPQTVLADTMIGNEVDRCSEQTAPGVVSTRCGLMGLALW